MNSSTRIANVPLKADTSRSELTSSTNGARKPDRQQAIAFLKGELPSTNEFAKTQSELDDQALDHLIKFVAKAVNESLQAPQASSTDLPVTPAADLTAATSTTGNLSTFTQNTNVTGVNLASAQSPSPTGASLAGTPSSFLVTMMGTLQLLPESDNLGVNKSIITPSQVATADTEPSKRPKKAKTLRGAPEGELPTIMNSTTPRTTLIHNFDSSRHSESSGSPPTQPKPKNREPSSTIPSPTPGQAPLSALSMADDVHSPKKRIQFAKTSSTVNTKRPPKTVTFASGASEEHCSQTHARLDDPRSPPMTRVAGQAPLSGDHPVGHSRISSSHSKAIQTAQSSFMGARKDERVGWSGYDIKTPPPPSQLNLSKHMPRRRHRRSHSMDTIGATPGASRRASEPTEMRSSHMNDRQSSPLAGTLLTTQSPKSLLASKPRTVRRVGQFQVGQTGLGFDHALEVTERSADGHSWTATSKLVINVTAETGDSISGPFHTPAQSLGPGTEDSIRSPKVEDLWVWV
ncbi:hypothetical protein TREMEDRAFT_60422 [Tremella mesenterica DSM 1558]|uniref:uncharacterized protein n=1 Tax=Tremella mesenterica (strain ATCC 24925 / CBS 8224 / DSM 1558 / NBRC 9311 / NRRL Y-6157 / RJB 2259-6 / UBC 559-6) TaxID=578456 RepID=UPI0003F48FD6|nr:uncharacterized protein TREMEDRAFT_60422 [Tremella mesenterica DSM 1558]EIW71491.1 hypothetical protein TREMEDRAFT_60422 [Tremella mesenterica DSM 1558]